MSLSRAISFLYPDAVFTVWGDDYESMMWEGPGDKPDEGTLRSAEAAADISFENDQQRQRRANAYQQEADPLFFGWQRGENTQQEWLDKVQEIRDRHPYS